MKGLDEKFAARLTLKSFSMVIAAAQFEASELAYDALQMKSQQASSETFERANLQPWRGLRLLYLLLPRLSEIVDDLVSGTFFKVI